MSRNQYTRDQVLASYEAWDDGYAQAKRVYETAIDDGFCLSKPRNPWSIILARMRRDGRDFVTENDLRAVLIDLAERTIADEIRRADHQADRMEAQS